MKTNEARKRMAYDIVKEAYDELEKLHPTPREIQGYADLKQIET